jgi:FkbM family methyltransferase
MTDSPDFQSIQSALEQAGVSAHLGTVSHADIFLIYNILLSRKPDPEGWAHWQRKLAKPMPVSTEDAASEFIHSLEMRARWFRARPFLVETKHGFRIWIDEHDSSVSKWISAAHTYEPHVTAFVLRELANKGGTFVDIGANIGWFLTLVATHFPGRRILAFEPSPANQQLCYRNLSQFTNPNATLFPFAASDRRGFLGIEQSSSNAAVVAANDNLTLTATVCADDFVLNEPDIALIKIDIEGHEPLAIKGLAQTITKHRPTLVTEFHPACLRDHSQCVPEDYLRQLQAFGYGFAAVSRNLAEGEIALASVAHVMDYFAAESERYKLETDAVHIDLVCRIA